MCIADASGAYQNKGNTIRGTCLARPGARADTPGLMVEAQESKRPVSRDALQQGKRLASFENGGCPLLRQKPASPC